jgi:outer membrane receptor protein involved in Fe transport
MMNKKFFAVNILVFFWSAAVMAGITGKISGRIVDVQNNENLPGVNILVEGAMLGAATDLEGYFVIINVPPGTYKLNATMIGYAPSIVENVIVKMDQTTVVDLQMQLQSIDISEVVVVAQRPLVETDVSASELYISDETVERLPIKTVDEVLALHAGIEPGREGVTIRGGTVRQTSFLVDGLSMNDERWNVPFTAFSLNALEEVRVQTGGFSAEYGNIRSGVINLVTKEGQPDRYSGSVTVQYRAPGDKHFGPSIYDPNTYFTRPYTDPAVMWSGTASGGWDAHTQRQYPFFEGWNTVSEATLQDSDPGNDLTASGAYRLWQWQHRRQGDITKPDYVIDATFGGPIPLLGEKLGNARFFLSHFRQRAMFVFPLSRDNYQDNITQLKLISNLNPAIKLTVTGLYGEVHSVSPFNWRPTPTGRALRTSSEIADLVNSSSGNSILYMPGFFSPSSIYRTMVGFKLNHTLSSRTYYEISLQHNINRYNTFKLADRDISKRFEPVPGFFTDEAPFGYFGFGLTGIDGMSMGGWMNLGRDNSELSTTQFRADLVTQLNESNQVKTGLTVAYNDYNIKSFTESPSMDTWNRRQVFRDFPYRVGAYLQDKLEFKGFIANLGLRLDYSSANGQRYQLADYDDLLREGFGDLIETQAPVEDTKANWYLSPRLGVAHPITENSKLYFNYGHYTQEAASTYRFRLQREYSGLVTSIGEPNLIYEKTVAYELGYEHSLFDQYLISAAGYYKDITDQPGWIEYTNLNGSVNYERPANNQYEDIRGFELTLSRRAGNWFRGFVNYTYEVRTFGYFGLLKYFEDPNKQREYLRENPKEDRTHPQPYARANISLFTPGSYGPQWLGHHLLGDWQIDFLANWKAGAFETYNPNSIPGVVDNVQWKDRFNIDMRLSKSLRLLNFDMQLYLDVTNLLNTKYLSEAGFSDSFDRIDYLESLHFDWEEGPEHGNDKIGDVRDPGVAYEPYNPDDPTISDADLQRILDTKAYIDMPNLTYFTFLNPRSVRWGIKLSF